MNASQREPFERMESQWIHSLKKNKDTSPEDEDWFQAQEWDIE